MAATTAMILLVATFVAAVPDPIIETCSQPSTFGCPQVIQFLDPCGGGASNSSLQQDLIYTPTASLGGCQCNSAFYNAFSSCLACIKSQGESSPEIQNQQDWVKNCDSYGFNFTANPIVNATNPSTGPNGSSSSNGLSAGAIVGIVIGVVGVLALTGAAFYFKNRKNKSTLETPYTVSGAGEYAPAAAAAAAATGTDVENSNNYHNADYSAANTYYPDSQQQYTDYNTYNNQPYQQNGYENNYGNNNYGGYGNDYQNEYYGNKNDMMMQPMEQSYVPPPHGSTSPNTAAAVAAAAAAVTSAPSPRPSDTFPQSLRSKPTAWNQPEPTSNGTLSNDKAEFEEGEEVLEPPPSQNRFGRDSDDFASRRSMTPPRPSYRDDFSRPSFEREPRLSSSDRGSVSGMGMTRSGHDSNSARDEDVYSGIEDSPEFARRRARAAELFSAESVRK